MFFKLFLLIRTLVNFPTAILDRVGFFRGRIIYKIRNNNLKFIARGGTEDMAEIVVVLSGYEYNTKNIKLPRFPTIVDLGGHIGSFSIYMAKNLKDKCKIFTFEPEEKNYSILKENILLNKLKSIRVNNLAISDYRGKGYLKKEKLNTDAYYLGTSRKIKNCEVSTLENALKDYKLQRIDLLKMDIEGGEYKIFSHKPSLDYIKKSVHYIFMEYHNINNHLNYSLIEETIKKNFYILNKRGNILTLENITWEGNN